MRKVAGGSVFLGLTALLGGFLFNLQPTVEAVTLARDSQENLQKQLDIENNQTIQQSKQELEQAQIQTLKDNQEKNNRLSVASAFRATAYCLKGRTAMGSGVRRGIVAADPRILPLGSQIQISAGAYSGTYLVADTGGAVKGRKLDIWMPSCVEAVRFGNRSITVSRLSRRG